MTKNPARNVWLVTGAGRGLGVDIARAALAAGHAVVATARDAAAVTKALGEHDDLLAVAIHSHGSEPQGLLLLGGWGSSPFSQGRRSRTERDARPIS